MMKDAEAHAEEDKKRREAVEMRNEADALAFRTEKLLADNAESISDDVKAPVVESLDKLKEALKGTDNNDEVKAAMDDLNEKASAMGQAMYAATQAQQQSEAPAEGEAAGEQAASDDDVVDAAVVVVRYFGGVKLGAGGLVHAYSHAVGQLLPQVDRVTRSLRELYTLDASHSDAGRLEAELRGRGIAVVDVSYAARVRFTLGIDPGGRDDLASTLAALTSGAAQLHDAGTAWVES